MVGPFNPGGKREPQIGPFARAGLGTNRLEVLRPAVSDIVSFSEPRDIPDVGEEEPDGLFEWGAPSDFVINDFREVADGGLSFDTEDQGQESVPPVNMSESGRSFDRIQYINENNPFQFIEVDELRAIEFPSPRDDSPSIRFNLNPPG